MPSHGNLPGSRSRGADQVLDTCVGPLFPIMSRLFFPLAISMMLSSTVGLVDMFVAGQLGPLAQAAVGLGDQLLFFVLVMGSGLATACSSFVSRTIGVRDFSSCRTYIRASLLLAFFVGVLSALLGLICAHPLLSVLGCRDDVSVLALPYTSYNSLGNAPFVISLCLSAIFRALGRPLLSVWLWLVTAVLANCLSLLLFFSGLKSAHSLDALAYAWDCGCMLGCILGLFLLKNAYGSLPGARASRAPGVEYSVLHTSQAVWELCRVAAPAVVTEFSLVLSNFFMYGLLSYSPAESASYQAAWTIKLKLEEIIALIPLLALGMTTAVIVGQNLGAGQTQRANRACVGSALWASGFMLLAGGAVSLAAPQLATCFGTDLATRVATVSLLSPSAILFPLTALSVIICAGMDGAGQTQPPMILNLVFQVAGRTLLCYMLAVHLSTGLAGISQALCLSQLLMAVACACTYAAKTRLVPVPATPIIQGGPVRKARTGKPHDVLAC